MYAAGSKPMLGRLSAVVEAVGETLPTMTRAADGAPAKVVLPAVGLDRSIRGWRKYFRGKVGREGRGEGGGTEGSQAWEAGAWELDSWCGDGMASESRAAQLVVVLLLPAPESPVGGLRLLWSGARPSAPVLLLCFPPIGICAAAVLPSNEHQWCCPVHWIPVQKEGEKKERDYRKSTEVGRQAVSVPPPLQAGCLAVDGGGGWWGCPGGWP